MKLLCRIVFSFLFVLCYANLYSAYIPPSSSKKTYVVDNNYGVYCQYRTIAAAISAASNGDTIYVMPSQTQYDGFTLNKQLFIYSQNMNATNNSTNSYFIDAATIGLSNVTINSRACVIEGLEIASNINFSGNSTQINNCTFTGNVILNSDSNQFTSNHFRFDKNQYFLFNSTSLYNKIANNHIEKFQYSAISGTVNPFVDGADSTNQFLNNIFVERENFNQYAPVKGYVFFKNSRAKIKNNIFWSEIDDRAAFDTLATNCTFYKNITYSRFNSPTNLQDTGNYNDTFVKFKFHDIYTHTIPFNFPDPDNFALKSTSIGKNAGTDGKDIGVSGGSYLYRAHGQKNNGISVYNLKVPSKVINKDTLKLQLILDTKKDTFACNNFSQYCATIDSVFYSFDTTFQIHEGNQKLLFVGNKSFVDTTLFLALDSMNIGAHTLIISMKSSTGVWSYHTSELINIKPDANYNNISNIEYAINNGAGTWQQVSFTTNDSVDMYFDINIDDVAIGAHTLLVRTKLSNGLYSPWQVHPFNIYSDSFGIIEKVEYTFDKDTARDKWTQLSITPNDSIDILKQVNIDHLSVGAHMLLVRNFLGNNLYSPWQVHPFFIKDTIVDYKITGYSYSIDSSLHNSPFVIKKSITPADSINTIFSHLLDSNLNYGVHYLRVWAQHSNTHNSTWHIDTFELIDCPMLDSADFKIENNLCKDNQIKFKQDITKLGIWSKDSFNFNWHIDNSLNGTSDTLLKTFNTAKSYQIKFSFTKKSNAKCKGEIVKSIIIQPSNKDTTKQSICGNDSVFVHGVYRKTTGTYTFSGTNIYGCDSTSTYILTTHPVYTFRDTFTFCNGDSIKKHTKTFKTAGTYTNKFTTSKGCDSTWITKINVNPVYTFKDTFTLCNGDSVMKHTKTFKTAGTFTTKFSTIKGCDSTWITQINVNPVYTFRDTFTLCNGDSVMKHTKTFKTAGTYSTKFSTTKGCDSTWITKINVNPVYTFRDTFTLCNGDSIKKHTKTFKTASTYTSKFMTYKGCDSTWITKINVNPVYTFRDTFTLCNGDSVKKHTKTFKTAGNYTTKFSTIKGCDSIWITKIYVNPTYSSVINRGLCGGDSILFEGSYRKTTGIYTVKYNTIKGCDSIRTLNLTVENKIIVNLNPIICFGDSFLSAGNFKKQQGIFYDTLTALKGCDSVVITNLTIRPLDSMHLYQTICANDTIQFFNQKLHQTGTYLKVLKNRFTCDSFVYLHLKVRPLNFVNLNKTICNGDSIYTGNTWKKIQNNYTDVLTDINGCDSFVYTNLIVNPTYLFSETFDLCNGDSVIKHGKTFKTAGIYNSKFNSIKGCDSTWITKINVNPVYTFRDTFTLCNGDSIKKHTKTFKTAGTYTTKFITIKGCDSTWITKIIVNPVYTFRDTFTLCNGDSVIQHGKIFKTAGIYNSKFSTSKGCDSIWITKINVNPSYQFVKYDTICAKDNYVFYGNTLTSSGHYVQKYTTTMGCDSVYHLYLHVREWHKVVILSAGFNQLTTDSAYASYQWYLNRTILSGKTNRTIITSQQGLYDVSVTNRYGCTWNSWDNTTGIQDIENSVLKIYPNPASNWLKIESETDGLLMKCYDNLGKLILSQSLAAGENMIPINDLSEGVYYFHISGNGSFYQTKIVIVK